MSSVVSDRSCADALIVRSNSVKRIIDPDVTSYEVPLNEHFKLKLLALDFRCLLEPRLAYQRAHMSIVTLT